MEQTTLAYRCFEQIREKIINGAYLPGAKLAVVRLSKEIQAGPTPVREALSRLTQTGLVEVVENQGFRVSALSEEGIRDLYHTFFQIADLGLAQAIEKGDDAWASQVVAALYQLSLVEASGKLTLKQYPLWAERNEMFHTALLSGCGSPCLIRIHDQLFMQFDRYIRLAFFLDPKPFQIDHNDHKLLAEAALNRDKGRAHRLLKEQAASGVESLIDKLKTKKIL